MIALALDGLLVLVAAEAVALALLHARTGRGIPPRRLWPNLAAGGLLMGGVRLALGSAAPAPAAEAGLALVLAGAGIAHVLDMAARWQR